jgi:hypothetical protein
MFANTFLDKLADTGPVPPFKLEAMAFYHHVRTAKINKLIIIFFIQFQKIRKSEIAWNPMIFAHETPQS